MSDERWLSDWLLGEGTDEERREMEARLAADPELRARARSLQAVTGRLRDLPPSAWEAITERDAQALPPLRRERKRRRWMLPRPVLAGLVVGVLFAVGVGVGELLGSGGAAGGGGGSTGSRPSPSGPSGPTVVRIALRPLQGAPAKAAGVADVTGGDGLRLAVADLPATGAEGYYEAWLMTDTQRLVPLASFRVNGRGRARLALRLPTSVHRYRYIDVSLQRVGGGTEHSRRSVLRGPT